MTALPAIHDISTDLDRPPAFTAGVPLRAGAPNPMAYPGPEVAAKQRAGYPDLGPILVARPLAATYRAALAVVAELGWELVVASPGTRRIEATDTTAWFGFTGDIVVRIQPAGDGARVDVRSRSRVGRSDLGANAERIRRFRTRLQAALEH